MWLTSVNQPDNATVLAEVDGVAGNIDSCRGDWSPDGTRIVYQSQVGGSTEVWIMDADGSHQTKRTSSGDSYYPVFSPDGNWNAFGDHQPGQNPVA
jgi:Tol biopolymer transport system component